MEYKQDMPPKGGYERITYKRLPIKPGINAFGKIGITLGMTIYGAYLYHEAKDRINNYRIEDRCAKLALHPMLVAEVDRMVLKQLKRNREIEEEIMKDVEGWEVGKWKGHRIYKTIGPDEYFKPEVAEYYVHAPDEWVLMIRNITKDN